MRPHPFLKGPACCRHFSAAELGGRDQAERKAVRGRINLQPLTLRQIWSMNLTHIGGRH
jgi:hypothetical protein